MTCSLPCSGHKPSIVWGDCWGDGGAEPHGTLAVPAPVNLRAQDAF